MQIYLHASIHIYGMVFRHRNEFTFICYPTPTFLLYFFPCITQQPRETTGLCIIPAQWIYTFHHIYRRLCYKTCSKRWGNNIITLWVLELEHTFYYNFLVEFQFMNLKSQSWKRILLCDHMTYTWTENRHLTLVPIHKICTNNLFLPNINISLFKDSYFYMPNNHRSWWTVLIYTYDNFCCCLCIYWPHVSYIVHSITGKSSIFLFFSSSHFMYELHPEICILV